jgi:IS5 family transposase
MIIEASSVINVRVNHTEAWPNFYTKIWREEFGTSFGVPTSTLTDTLNRHLGEFRARVKQKEGPNSDYLIEFDNEADFAWFNLKWTGANE